MLCGGVQRVRCQKRCCPARTTRAQRATDPRGARNTQSNTIFCRQSHLCPTLSVHRFHQIVDGGGLCGRRCAGKRGVREKGRRSEAVMLSCEDDARRRARRATGPRGAARATHKASSLLFGCSPPPRTAHRQSHLRNYTHTSLNSGAWGTPAALPPRPLRVMSSSPIFVILRPGPEGSACRCRGRAGGVGNGGLPNAQ